VLTTHRWSVAFGITVFGSAVFAVPDTATPSRQQGIFDVLDFVRQWLLALQTGKRGVTALEYGLLASLIAIAIVAGVYAYGTNLSAQYINFAGKV